MNEIEFKIAKAEIEARINNEYILALYRIGFMVKRALGKINRM